MCTPVQDFPFPVDSASIQAFEFMKEMIKSGELPSLPDNVPFPDILNSVSTERRLDIADVAADISQKLTEWDPLFVKVTEVIDETTLKITSCDHPVGPEDFWADDREHVSLSREQKERLHLQYHRSFGTHRKVLAFVSALQVLCDSGISFHHDGAEVVDIWVSSTSEFDISDILETRILNIVDPVHEMLGFAVNNHERMETLRRLHRKAYRKLGMEAQCSRRSVEYIKKHRPYSYRGSMPHWWVIAITEGPMRSGIIQRCMVHLDICGAAFDDVGFRTHNGKLTSLHVFTTPEYVLLTDKSSTQDAKTGILGPRKFVMDSGTRSTANGWNTFEGKIIYCPQPYSMRHLRCFIPRDGSCVANVPSIEVTSLDTFVARSAQFMPENLAQWYRIIADLRHKLVLELPAATPVLIRNLTKRPELNGRSGHIFHGENTVVSPDRVGVSTKGESGLLSLRTTSIGLTERTQYKSHAEILERIEKLKPKTDRRTGEVKKPTRQEEEACYKALRKDPNLTKAFDLLNHGNVTIVSFASPALAKGMRKLTKPPFDRIISTEEIECLKEGLLVADHPKFAEAFKIVKLINHAKQRVMETDPGMIAGDGSILIGDGSDFERLAREIAKKIKQDKALTEVFELMNEKNLFPNPVEQWGPYSL